MATPDMASVPTCPTMMLSSRDTKLVITFCTSTGSITASSR